MRFTRWNFGGTKENIVWGVFPVLWDFSRKQPRGNQQAELIVMLPRRTSLRTLFNVFRSFRSAGTSGFISLHFSLPRSVQATSAIQNTTLCFVARASIGPRASAPS